MSDEIERATCTTLHAVRVTVEMRPPRAGEIAWSVDEDATADEALESVINGRVEPSPISPYGYGWRTVNDCDGSVDDEGLIVVTVFAEEITRDLPILVPVPRVDAPLLLGVIEHAIGEGEANLADPAQAYPADVRAQTESFLGMLRGWARTLREVK